MNGAPSHSNIFIRGLPASLDQLTLQQLFQSFGAIESCRVQKDQVTGQSKGYGFVKYATIEAAEHAIKSLDGSSLAGSQIHVKFASSDVDASSGGVPSQPNDNLYVRNLVPTWTDQDILGIFQAYGTVKELRVLSGPPGSEAHSSAGALVRMGSSEEAAKAIAGVNAWAASTGTGNGTFPVSVKYADSPEERARRHAKRQRVGSHTPMQPMSSPGQTQAAYPPPLQSYHHPTAQYQPPPEVQYQQPGYGAGAVQAEPYGRPLDPYGASAAAPAYQHPLTNGYSGSSHQYGAQAAATQQQYVDQHAPSSVYVKNLPPEADKLLLYEKFAPHGGISSVKVMIDDQGRGRGFGFVNFTSPVAAAGAIAAVHGTVAGDKTLHVSLQTGGGRPQPKRG